MSGCPISVVPTDRKMTRREYQRLSSMARLIWREHGEAIETSAADALIEAMVCGVSKGTETVQ